MAIRRTREDRIIFGLCGGIAKNFGIDPLWIRLGFLVAFIMFGAGVLIYLLGTLITKSED